MGIRIVGEGVGGVHLTLACDVPGCNAVQSFAEGHFIEQRSVATRAGWVERQLAAGREFVCPRCSGLTAGDQCIMDF